MREGILAPAGTPAGTPAVAPAESNGMLRQPAPASKAVSTSKFLGRAAILAILLLALRIPLLDHPTPVHVDETDFLPALGFPSQYPVHHPGYPLWVAMGTALRAAGLEPYAAYQAWAVAASVLAPLLLYLGLRRMVGDGLAWWLAMALGLNPLVWFHSVTAMTYVPAGAAGLLVVGLSYRAMTRQSGAAACWAAGVLAVGMFLRADLLIQVGPLVFYAACRTLRRSGWLALLIVGASFLELLIVTQHLYARTDTAQGHAELSHTVGVILGTSVFRLGVVDGLVRNGVKIGLNLAWDFGVGVLLLPWALCCVARTRGRQTQIGRLLLLWAGPLLLFLLLMHAVQGYFMLLVPAGLAVIGLALCRGCAPRTAVHIAAAVAVCSALQFVMYPWSPQSTGPKRLLDAKIAFQSMRGLQEIDQLPMIDQPGDFWPTAAHKPAEPLPPTPRPRDRFR